MLCERCEARFEPALPEINRNVFDRERRCIITEGNLRSLSPKAWSLLELLWRHRTRLVSHEQIYDWLYSEELDPPFTHIVTVYIHHLRKALVGSPYQIVLVWGEGYRLEAIESMTATQWRKA